MPLTSGQRQQLIAQCNKVPVATLIQYIASGDITLEELSNLDTARKAYIEDFLKNQPNPLEVADWQEIEALNGSVSQYAVLLIKLEYYIKKWSATLPPQNHVEEAQRLICSVSGELEEADWARVDQFNYDSLVNHYRKYPHTVHFTEIDEGAWNLLEKANLTDLQRYIHDLPQGKHVREAEGIINAFGVWDATRNSNDLFEVYKYIRQYPASPFLSEAQFILDSLKKEELQIMKENVSKYDIDRFVQLKDEAIFSEQELIAAGVTSKWALEKIEEMKRMVVKGETLPELIQTPTEVISDSDHTDVFLFGIPSSGKTCVLMGLLGADGFYYDNAVYGGDYADTLGIYRTFGKTPDRTSGLFVTLIDSNVRERFGEEVVDHKVSLVEMSGEEFGAKIAFNEEAKVSFEDLGTGATKLLTTENKKVIFIVIDPSASGLVTLATQRADGTFWSKTVNQAMVITKIINMLKHTPSVLENVDSIHFVMAKSDMLGDCEAREQVAVDRFKRIYGKTLEPLKDLCKEYGINRNSNYAPKLYTFSLGKFYVGGLFEYDNRDADKLVDVIKSVTRGERKQNTWGKIKTFFN